MMRKTAFVVLFAAAACADNHPSVEIDGRAAPSDVTTCLFAAGGQFLLGPGLLDVGVKTSYEGHFYIRNNISDPSASDPNTVKSAKAWHGDAVKVRINPSDYVSRIQPSPALANFSGELVMPVATNTVAPETADVVSMDLLAPGVGGQIANLVGAGQTLRIVLGITLEGETLDGQRIQTNEFFYPVDVCRGCLAEPVCPAGTTLTAQTCDGAGQDRASICK
jgi:hypothetical protein